MDHGTNGSVDHCAIYIEDGMMMDQNYCSINSWGIDNRGELKDVYSPTGNFECAFRPPF